MIARELLDTAAIPGGGELRLFRRELKGADEYSIMLGRIELMNSRLSGSEEALATLTCAGLQVKNPRLLIGGYGIDPCTRLGLDPDSGARERHDAALDAVQKWRRMSEHPLLDPFTARACSVAARSAEGVVVTG